MDINLDGKKYASDQTGISGKQVQSVLDLLLKEDCTIPFITRYRKERTGGLDEEQVRDIQKNYDDYLEREKRRQFILETLQKQAKLTPELKKSIQEANSLNQLEDIYAPYKGKKKTKGQLAQEAGLLPLSTLIIEGKFSPTDLKKKESEFLNPEHGIKNFEDALSGAQNIIIEKISHHLELKENLREVYWKEAKISSKVKKDADKIKDSAKFKDYYDYSEKIKDLKSPKSGHRFLAMRRGSSKKILRIEVEYSFENALPLIKNHFDLTGKLTSGILNDCAKKAFQNYIHPSLDNEIKTDLKNLADESAIQVFKVNLKNLLLQPYLGAKAVLGLDPGIRSGVKLAVVGETGEFLFDTVIHPHEPQKDLKGSTEVINRLIEHFKVEYLAIGNGTFGRETLNFVKENIPAIKEGKVHATLINEDGASIYSTSPVAKEEFPDKDAVVRGAISIARRFQDPLAELVKIDPKSLGVGQYQHDVNQTLLKRSLGGIVEGCVNFVGVNLNTASAPLLSYISGIGPTLAKSIVKKREEIGGFKDRQELLKVSRFSPKVFQQSAGFLRIYNGTNPLDGTFIHPEKYPVIEKWTLKRNIPLKELVKEPGPIEELVQDNELIETLGEYTHADIVTSLKAPGQDPRTKFKSFQFRSDATDIKSIKVNDWYPGQVTNITQFGAFVDIGIKENGLVHVSQMSDQFVDNPLNVFTLGQEVKVRVIEIDIDRGRLSLSCKSQDVSKSKKSTKKPSKKQKKASKPTKTPKNKGKEENLKQNPFAALKNIKLK